MLLPILKRVGIGVGLATALVIAVGLALPDSYTVTRSIVIDAPRERIHEFCGDLQAWPRWTPWFKADPSLQVTLGAVTSGVGAQQTWTGKDGQGELVLTDSDPARGIAFDMAFAQPAYQASCTIAYAHADSGTVVTWTMSGRHGWNLLERYAGLLTGALVGPMFDEGLARLKLVAEEAPDDARWNG